MSSYFIAYIIFAAIVALISFFLKRSQQKNLLAHINRLEDMINKNAAICNDNFAIQRAIVCYGEYLDPLYHLRLQYLKLHIETHRNNPNHYPLEVEKWLMEFDLVNPQTNSKNDKN